MYFVIITRRPIASHPEIVFTTPINLGGVPLAFDSRRDAAAFLEEAARDFDEYDHGEIVRVG